MPRAPASASGAEKGEKGEEVSQVVETSLVQGERMEIHHGDPVLASDLPSAKEDFSQVSRLLCAYGYRLIDGFVSVVPSVITEI